MPVFTVVSGIIPTRMGTRSHNLLNPVASEDHPHAYGDKYPSAFIASADVGSSPRVWGQGINSRQIICTDRIIPTRMGTRSHNLLNPVVSEDHPHAYGDKLLEPYQVPPMTGSSPRVWGQDEFVKVGDTITRIIPTRMGTSTERHLYCRCTQDHPHAYGDKTKEIKENSGFAKSTA